MIELFSLFVGLTTGLQTIELVVLEPVTSVELRLNGQLLGTVTGEPWALECDLGEDLVPHELVAIGRDRDGQEVERIQHWLNIAPSWDEWQNPAFEPEGQQVVDAQRSGQTPVLLTLAHGAELPEPETLGSWFLAAGQPVRVTAIENPPAEVVILRDPAVQPLLHTIADTFYQTKYKSLLRAYQDIPQGVSGWSEGWMDQDPDRATNPYQSRILRAAQASLREAARLGPNVKMRFLSPWAAPVSQVETDRELYAVTEGIEADSMRGFLEITNQVASIPFAYRLADAVALAAIQTHGSAQRRAVVLLLDEPREDDSHVKPNLARGYLRQLQVPLFVWSTASEEPHPDWGETRHVGFHNKRPRETWPDAFAEAAADLKRHLESQRVVWLAGRHLPQTIELRSASPGIQLTARQPIGQRP